MMGTRQTFRVATATTCQGVHNCDKATNLKICTWCLRIKRQFVTFNSLYILYGGSKGTLPPFAPLNGSTQIRHERQSSSSLNSPKPTKPSILNHQPAPQSDITDSSFMATATPHSLSSLMPFSLSIRLRPRKIRNEIGTAG